MQIKRAIAGSIAAIATGATVMGVIFAQTSGLGSYVKAGDGTLSSPIIVIGGAADKIGPQYPNDVLGAADIAAAVAGYATTPVAVSGGTDIGVSGGAKLETGNTKVYFGDALTKSGLKTTVTKNDPGLSDLLASGTFIADDGTTVLYDQFITFRNGAVSFGKSNGDLSDPALYLDTGFTTTTPLYEATVTFNKLLNVSNSNVQNKKIKLFGTDFTIGSQSAFDSSTKKIVLFGSANTQLFSEGEERTVTIGSVDHTVKLLGVSGATTAVVQVDGESKSVVQGGSYKIAGVDVFIDQTFYYPKESQVSQAKIGLGSSRFVLENGTTVKVGTNEDTVDGTMATMSGTAGSGISKLTVAVTAKNSNNDYILMGKSFKDPVFQTFWLAFGGTSGGATEMITADNSGSTQAQVKFTDYRGKTGTITWATAQNSLPFVAGLNATTTQKIHVVENELVSVGDYVLLAPNVESDFGHVFKYSTSSSLGSSGAYIELQDLLAQSTNRIYLTDSGYASGNFYIDGQQYYVQNATSTSAQAMRFSWGGGAAAGSAGSATTLFPLIRTSMGGYLTFAENVTLTNATTYELPTNATFTYTLLDPNFGNGTAPTFGRVQYNITPSGILRLGDGSGGAFSVPSILFLEEKGRNTAETDVKDAIIVGVSDGSGSGVDLSVGGLSPSQQPVMTAATRVTTDNTLQSDNSVSIWGDRYGTMVKFDTDNQGLVEMTYPDEQARAAVAVGPSPTFSTAAGGTTVETAVKIKNPVAKLDTEIDTSALNGDLILVGGPCVNTLVAKLAADAASGIPACDAWNLQKGLIKEVANAFNSGKKALVVAGNTGMDTRSLAADVIKGTLAFSS